MILCEIVRFPILLGVWGPHTALPKRPRSLQDGSLIVLDSFFSTPDFRFDFGWFSAPFLIAFGRPNCPHRVAPNWGYPPYLGPSRSYGRLGAVLRSTCGLGSFWNPLRPVLGPFLAAPGAISDPLGVNVCFVGAVLRPFSFFCCSILACRFSSFHISDA